MFVYVCVRLCNLALFLNYSRLQFHSGTGDDGKNSMIEELMLVKQNRKDDGHYHSFYAVYKNRISFPTM